MEFSAFEVLGPIMVGPSSSHTAGACRIANVAKSICGEGFKSVEFQLHGSFAYTYKGHGTDKALLAGIMGYNPDDNRINQAFDLAEQKKLKYSFSKIDLGDSYHPNSAKIIFHFEGRDEFVIGSSIGGGSIMIVDINGMSVEFRGHFPTLLLQYEDKSGVIACVSSILSKNNYNIESINTVKDPLTNVVTLTVEIDKNLTEPVRDAIIKSDRFITAKYVEV